MVRNMECMLVRYTGATPFKRCQYCNRRVQDCFGLLFFVISVSIIGLLTTTFFISDIPILILDIIILVDLLVILLAFLASKETNEIVLNNYQLKKLTMELQKAEDTAERKTVDLQKSNEEQIKINQMKNEFIGIINHELKEPVAAIISGMEIFKAHGVDKLNESQIKMLDIIDKSGRDMIHLINNLLELSKIDSGKIEVYPEFFPLINLIDEVVLSIKPEADKKNIRIDRKIDKSTSIIYADPQKLKQILYNLVDNSVKYTPKNGTINIDAASSDDSIKLEIRDSGLGIKKEHLIDIFSKFAKHSPGYEGTGLGLYIVKSFIEAHNGTIEVESEYGKGTTFRIFLPQIKAM
jgi:signal transduction histidine kinase